MTASDFCRFIIMNRILILFLHQKSRAIISSGLLSSIRTDAATIAEHLFFNYPLSDHTYIQNFKPWKNAECFNITRDRTVRKKYWSVAELTAFRQPAKKKVLNF